jgi:hypothetical protein
MERKQCILMTYLYPRWEVKDTAKELAFPRKKI